MANSEPCLLWEVFFKSPTWSLPAEIFLGAIPPQEKSRRLHQKNEILSSAFFFFFSFPPLSMHSIFNYSMYCGFFSLFYFIFFAWTRLAHPFPATRIGIGAIAVTGNW
jgi:hypothetical protein